MTELAFLDFLV